ncbi:hypothetical protein BX600DRAFT_171202 [Xylariales sp. PMI_506]|nr:hypothetical protein BX600DRAFT_171202 [Xylariales sp. PMI_506]
MGGLVPLLLPSPAGTRSSTVSESPTRRRQSSIMANAVSPGSRKRQQFASPEKFSKRFSMMPLTLPIIPSTADEWKIALNEIKAKYVERKYRTCSTRCCEIIDNVKDVSNVETLHLICLHFYAASSFELCARPLSQSSAYRTTLLKDARKYYDTALELIQAAETVTNQRTRSPSSSSTATTSSSLHSPSSSISSRASTASTELSTPRNSLSSLEGFDISSVKLGKPLQKKKKVSFSGLPESIIIPEPNWQPELLIRPDSPTLGWEEDELLFGRRDISPDLADIDTFKSARTITEHLAPLSILKSSHVKASEADKARDSFDLESFLHARSMRRISTQLSAIRSQVSWHREAVSTLLSETYDHVPDSPEHSDVPPVPEIPRELIHNTANTFATADLDDDLLLRSPSAASQAYPLLTRQSLRHQMSNISLRSQAITDEPQGESWVRKRSDSVSSSLPPRPSSAASSYRGSDEGLHQRIERLRANGWQRKRFDGRRYEVLREQVLSELRP